MARKHLIFAFVLGAGVALVTPAVAEYPVLDLAVVQQIQQEIQTLTQELQTAVQSMNILSSLKDIESAVQSAIGTVSQITLPITNLESMESQLRSNLSCLLPSASSFGIKFEEINFGSVCDTAKQYRDALFIDKALPAIQAGTSTMTLEQTEVAITQRREGLVADTGIRSLAQADASLNKEIGNLTNSADDLQNSLNASKTMQDRLAVIGQIGLLQVRAQADANQLTALLLKLQAAQAIAETRANLTVSSIPATSGSGQ